MSFFNQNSVILDDKKILLKRVLIDYGFNFFEIDGFLVAYEFFKKNPDKFDGATIVQDTYTINGLDAVAMVHDYLYIKFDLSGKFKKKFKADLLYAKLLRKFNVSWVSVWLVRFLGLIISTPIFALYKCLIKPTYSVSSDDEFNTYITRFQ